MTKKIDGSRALQNQHHSISLAAALHKIALAGEGKMPSVKAAELHIYLMLDLHWCWIFMPLFRWSSPPFFLRCSYFMDFAVAQIIRRQHVFTLHYWILTKHGHCIKHSFLKSHAPFKHTRAWGTSWQAPLYTGECRRSTSKGHRVRPDPEVQHASCLPPAPVRKGQE